MNFLQFLLQKKYNLLFVIACFFFLFFFILFSRRSLDPDFGWHITLGRTIAQHGIPLTDPFSYTMSYFHFVDHEWLTNTLLWISYQRIGLEGLSLFFAGLAFITIYLSSRALDKRWRIVPFILTSLSLIPFLGIRPQAISWFFFSILLFIALREELWRKFRWVLPFLFLLWVNLHGAFALGIVVTTLVALLRALQKRKISFVDLLIVALSLGATFVNPYAERIWWEIWMQMSNASLHWSIGEWLPAFSVLNYGFVLLLPLSAILTFRYYKKFSLIEISLYILLLIMAISSIRHLPFWLLIALPVTTKEITFFYQEIKENKLSKRRFFISYSIFFTMALGISLILFFFSVLSSGKSQLGAYPTKAVNFLRAHPSGGNLFADYGWGGYLIWKFSEKKVFIDGRMPSWRSDIAPASQSRNAFKEYSELVNGSTKVNSLLGKYYIDTLMLPKQDNQDHIEDRLEKLIGRNLPFPNYKRLAEQLNKRGMAIVYQDNLTVVYRNK